ncbi:MAG: ABC transporter permease [Vicinamibacterales bacterium]
MAVASALTVFALVDAGVLRRLPFAQPDALARVHFTRGPAGPAELISEHEFLALRQRAHGFKGIAALKEVQLTVKPATSLEVLNAARVSGEFFALLGVRALHGTTFGQEAESTPDIVVLSYWYWRDRFGGDPAAIGRLLPTATTPLRIVGVMPPEFRYPMGVTRLGLDLKAWAPLPLAALRPPNPNMRVGTLPHFLARLDPADRLAAAEARLRLLVQAQRADTPRAFGRSPHVHLESLRRSVLASSRGWMSALAVALGLLLLSSALGSGGLLLFRMAARMDDLRIQATLGADHIRLLMQLAIEGALTTMAGSVAGVLLAYWMVEILGGAIPATLVLVGAPRLGTGALLMVLALFASPVALFCLLAVRKLRSAAAAGVAGITHASRLRISPALVGGQLFLAAVLLTGTLAFTLSFARLASIDLGFTPTGVAVLAANARGNHPARGTPYVSELSSAIGRLPYVSAVAAVAERCSVPFVRVKCSSYRVSDVASGRTFSGDEGIQVHEVTASYFDAMGMTLRSGALPQLTNHDPTIILNEHALRTYRGSPWTPGMVLSIDGQLVSVIGVVADALIDGPEEPSRLEGYRVIRVEDLERGQLVLKANELDRAVDDATALVAAALPDQPVPTPLRLDAALTGLLEYQRFSTIVALSLGCLATVTAVVGAYALLALSLATRRKEIAIRQAVGGSRLRVAADIIGHDLSRAFAAIAAGGVVAMVLASRVESYLFNTGPLWIVALWASASLAFIVVLAALIPTAHAVRQTSLRMLGVAR